MPCDVLVFVVLSVEFRREQTEIAAEVYYPADTGKQFRNDLHRFTRRKSYKGDIRVFALFSIKFLILEVDSAGKHRIQLRNFLAGRSSGDDPGDLDIVSRREQP